jgi:hypothetical protein
VTDYSAPGIFNVLDYGMIAGPVTFPVAQNNAKFLQQAIDAAQASGNPNGAVVLIPSFSVDPTTYKAYQIACQTGDTSAVKIPNMGGATSILICGTGGGTQLTMFSTNDILFDVQSDSVSFQDLTINFDSSTSGFGTAFSFSSASGSGPANCNLFRVTILNTQNPVFLNRTQHARLLNCYIDYGDSTLSFATSAAVQIVGGSEDTVISQSILFWSASTPGAQNYGILIDGASNVKVSDTQVSSFGTCIQIQGSSSETTGVRVNGCDFYGQPGSEGSVGSCAVIDPTVSDICFMNCHFEAGSAYEGTAPGIAIGMYGGTNSEIDTVRLISCGLTGGSGMGPTDSYGLQIGVGQNIQILGGHYSGNGNTAGIAIVGGATQVQIIGANCIGLEYEAGHDSTPLYQLYGIRIANGSGIQILGVNCSGNGQPGDPGDGIHIDGTDATVSDVRIIGAVCTGPVFGNTEIEQQTGIYVKDAQGVLVKDCALSGSAAASGYGLYLGAVTDVTVKACDLYGNVTGLRIDTGSTRVYVRDCNATGYSPGYADAISIAASLTEVEVTNCAGYNDQHTLLTSTPPLGTFNGVSVGSYYGPAVFYVTGRTVTIDGQPTQLSSGGFTLAPGETAQVVGLLPGTFVMIGN